MVKRSKHTNLHHQAHVGELNSLLGYSYADLSLLGKGFGKFKCAGLGFSRWRT